MPISDELFDRVLPLPFRVIFLLNLGCWLWLAVLRTLERAQLSLSTLLKYPQQQSFIKSHVLICETVSIVSFVAYLLYGLFRAKTEDSLSFIDFIPFLTIMFSFWSFSTRFQQTIRRVLQCKIDLTIRTNDILLSDSLLSYSKISVDFLIYILHLFNFKTTYQVDNKIMINRSFGEFWNLGHLVLAYPVAIRMVQCFHEYKQNGNKTQLWNLGKYSINGLIILTSLITERLDVLFFLQLVAAVYSFVWDVTIDWDFNLLKKLYNGNFKVTNLRSSLSLFPDQPYLYYIIIFVNFLIRFNWILRYMNFDILNLEIGLFILQALEVFRRFLWILIKLDSDFTQMKDQYELSTYHES